MPVARFAANLPSDRVAATLVGNLATTFAALVGSLATAFGYTFVADLDYTSVILNLAGMSRTFIMYLGCTFIAGLDYTFTTGFDCTFATDLDCTFDANLDCTFDTNFGCTLVIE